MKPLKYKNNIYLPIPCLCSDLKEGDLFELRSEKTVYITLAIDDNGVKGVDCMNNTIRCTPDYPVLRLS